MCLCFFFLQGTFHYDSSLWSNSDTFNLAGGETGFDAKETKLPTYWNTSFSKICLGMKSVSRSVLLPSKKPLSLCTLWSLTANTGVFLWVVTLGSFWLALKRLCKPTATGKASTLHAGPGEGTKLHARKNFCVFYPIELKLCSIRELFIPNNRIVLFFCPSKQLQIHRSTMGRTYFE